MFNLILFCFKKYFNFLSIFSYYLFRLCLVSISGQENKRQDIIKDEDKGIQILHL